MANPEARMQGWNAADYDWLNGASGYPPAEITGLLTQWLTDVSGNPSVIAMSSSLPELVKDHTDSADARYYGWVIKMPQTTLEDTYYSLHSISTSRIRCSNSMTYTDDGSNGGYGTLSDHQRQTYDLNRDGWYLDESYISSSVSMYFTFAYDVSDGEEYFFLSSTEEGTNNPNDNWTWGIFRTKAGYWMSTFTTGNSYSSGVYGYGFNVDAGSGGFDSNSRLANQSQRMPQQYAQFRSVITSDKDEWPQPNDTLLYVSANPKLFLWTSTGNNGSWCYVDDEDTSGEIYLKIGHSPMWQRMVPNV